MELSPQATQPLLRTSRAISQINAGMVAEAVAKVAELAKNPNGVVSHQPILISNE